MNEFATSVFVIFSIFVVTLTSIAALYAYQWRVSRRLIRQWAVAQGYELVRVERPFFERTPFPIVQVRHRLIDRAVVRTRAGAERTAWLIYSHSFPGLGKQKLVDLAVVWDDEWDRKLRLFP